MNKYFYIFLVALAGLIGGAPGLENSSGDETLDTIAHILALICAGIMLVSGIIGAAKTDKGPGTKAVLIVLVVMATVGGLVTASLLM